MGNNSKLHVVESYDGEAFQEKSNELLNNGYVLFSANVTVLTHIQYENKSWFQGIFVKED